MDEFLKLENHIYKNQIKESLNIVEEYIKKNDVILVGGQSMDFSLKLKGSYIYDKYSVPDYDAISPDFYTHAKNITSILCKKQYTNVSLVPAIHLTTVRVKVSNYTVFDSTYCPEDIYIKIRTIKYLGINLIHPDYQKIDQLNSLSFLFEQTGPSQNIYHRMKKDISRNNLLKEYFPIISNNMKINTKEIIIPLKLITSINFKSFNEDENQYIESNDNICCHGFLGYSLYYQKIFELYQKNKYFLEDDDKNNIIELFDNIIKSPFTIKNKDCVFNIPKNENITLINGNNNMGFIEELLKKIYKKIKVENYNKLLEVKPMSKIFKTDNIEFEIFDLSGKLLSCNLFNFDDNNFISSNFNYLLSYFLVRYNFYDSDELYLSYYISLQNIIKIANILSNVENLNLSNFNYSISTYGMFNYSESFYYFIQNFNYLIKNNKNSEYKPGKIYTNYPNCNVDKDFEPDSSEYFLIDGKINDRLYTNHIKVLEKNNLL